MKDETRRYVTSIVNSTASHHAKALAIYGRLVADEGLFDKAFFGHKKTKKQKKRLDHLWQMSLKLGGPHEEGSSQTPNVGGLHRTGTDQGPPQDIDDRSIGEIIDIRSRLVERASGFGEDDTSEHHREGDGMEDQNDHWAIADELHRS